MALVIIINLIVVCGLVWLTMTKGVERALPLLVFVLVLCPAESQIAIPGLFLLTTWRVGLVTFTILYLTFKDSSGAPPILTRTPLTFLIPLHVVWCLLSTANSVSPVDSLKQVLSYAVEYYLLYFILTRTISSLRTIHKILAAMVIAVGIACVFGWVEAYYDWRVTQWFPATTYTFMHGTELEGRGERIISTFSNYSLFGAGIAFAIVDVFYFLRIAKTTAWKVLLWLTLILMFWVIYKTTTRGPWLAAIIGGVLLLLYSSAHTRKSFLVIASLCVAVFLIRPGVWETVKNQYLATIDTDMESNPEASSYQYRWALWRVGADVLARDPIREVLGYGMGTFYDLHIKAEFNGNPNFLYESCDEAWVQQMVETGYVGLGIFALVLITPALLTLRNMWKVPRRYRYLCWVLFINMVQYYFMMTNVAIYGWGQTAYMLWIWIAISVIYVPLVQKETVADDRVEFSQAEPLPQLVGAA